jgi:glycerate kinase
MKIVIAPDSFKESLSALEVCNAIEAGIYKLLDKVEIVKIPMADGGEGTVETLVEATNGVIERVTVIGPLGTPVSSFFGILGDGKTAVIEMASASGLPLVPNSKKNPLISTTFGTGQLIKHALDRGCRDFVIGLGGSATNDGGVGMAQALGGAFLDKDQQEVGFGGGALYNIEKVDLSGLDSRIDECNFRVACDVTNPLCGESGAAAVFGPQKGATPEMILTLDENLQHLATLIKRDLGIDVADIPGAGAAGGLGAGLISFCGAELNSGIDIVIETIKLKEKISGASLVITGEGQMDFQTCSGKTPYGVAMASKEQGIPVVAIVGSIGVGAEKMFDYGINSIFSIVDKPMSVEDSITNASALVTAAAHRIMRLLAINLHK